MDDAERDAKLAALLKHFQDHPEDRTPDFDRFVRELMLDPAHHKSLVDRVKRDDEEALKLLLPYALQRQPGEGRKFARKVISEAWRDDDVIH